MLEKNYFSWFLAFGFSLILNSFIIFSELYLISLNHLVNFGLLSFFEIGKHLDQVDGDSENILWRRDDLLIFFIIIA